MRLEVKELLVGTMTHLQTNYLFGPCRSLCCCGQGSSSLSGFYSRRTGRVLHGHGAGTAWRDSSRTRNVRFLCEVTPWWHQTRRLVEALFNSLANTDVLLTSKAERGAHLGKSTRFSFTQCMLFALESLQWFATFRLFATQNYKCFANSHWSFDAPKHRVVFLAFSF